MALLTLTSCSPAKDPQAREKELAFLRVLMPEELLPVAHVEVAGVENIAILSSGGEHHLALGIFPGQKKRNRGVRAEVSVDAPHEEGDTMRYECRFRVPEEFKSDALRNRWWIIGQWHDQPDRRKGETWDGFPSRSPPVLVGLGELDGRMAIGIEYGPTQAQKHGPIFIERGKWHRLALAIHWSQKADGKAEVFFDDMTRPAATLTGPNMHNAFQHYFKLGMYRHPDIATANWIYLDDLTIEKRLPERRTAP
jgi:hypothetical protein